VSIVLAVVVVVGLLTAGGILALSNSQGGTFSNVGAGASSTATAAAASTPTSSTTPLFSDPLTSDANGWSTNQNCYFRSDGFHINGSWECFAPTDVPDNFTAQVRVKQISGPSGDGYGVVFRRASIGNAYYFFIDGYGHWRVDKCVNNTCSALHNWSSSNGAVKQGANVANTLEVAANGSQFAFFANGTQLGQVTDSTFASGIFGLTGGQSSQVVYTDLVINQVS
jgi:hypothetical protein